MTGWKDCIYITKPGGVSWFPSPCISFSCGFQVGVDRRTHQPFFSSLPHSLASAQSRGVLLEQGHSTHCRHPGVGVYRNKAPVDGNTLAGKTTSGKQILSLSPKTRHINSLYFNTQTLHVTLTLFNCTSLTVSLAVADVYSSSFHFVCVLWLCSHVSSPSVHSFSLQQDLQDIIQNLKSSPVKILPNCSSVMFLLIDDLEIYTPNNHCHQAVPSVLHGWVWVRLVSWAVSVAFGNSPSQRNEV